MKVYCVFSEDLLQEIFETNEAAYEYAINNEKTNYQKLHVVVWGVK